MQVMVDELVQLYAAFSQGEVPQLPGLPIQYADYAVWQRQWMEAGEKARQLAYWRDLLGGEQPVLELPLDHAPVIAARVSTSTYRRYGSPRCARWLL